MVKKYLKKLFDLLERPLPYFLTFHLRPKRAAQVGVWSDKLKVMPKCAIVIQGPIVYKEDFTLETVKLYKKIFPEAIIILSTWDYEQKEYVTKIEREGAVVLLNTPPTHAGRQNINYQITSARAGVLHAKELGAEYALKTRTDVRIYDPDSTEYLHNVLQSFPVRGKGTQKNRIVGVSLNSFKYRLYGLSDINLFGQIDDMLAYWSAGLDIGGSTFSHMKVGLCEVYLATEFLKKMGHSIEWTLIDSWRAFADNFIFVDVQSLDLYWNKYARMKEYRYICYDAVKNDQEMTFKEWLNLYTGLSNKESVNEKNIIKIIP